MTIEKVADDAYFVPSYSVSTLAGYQEGVTNQGVTNQGVANQGVAVVGHVEIPGEIRQQTPAQDGRPEITSIS